MSLVIVGTVAFDKIETPFGKTDKILGGAATYIGIASSYFTDQLKVVSVIGEDFPEEYTKIITDHKMDTEGIYYIPVDGLREHETKQCVVCQETFESVFDDAADRWVYKPTRRVPAGLLHSHCWTQESESFVNKTETSDSSSKKRSLDDEENENDSEEGEPSLKRTKT